MIDVIIEWFSNPNKLQVTFNVVTIIWIVRLEGKVEVLRKNLLKLNEAIKLLNKR